MTQTVSRFADTRSFSAGAQGVWDQMAWDHIDAIIGHCRMATSGDYRDSRNNQPLLTEAGAVAHNGNVYNAAYLTQAFSLTLMTDCDSEVIGRLLERGLTAQEVLTVLPAGVPQAFLWLSSRQCLAARFKHPLYLWRQPEGLYVCSQKPHDDADLLPEGVTSLGGAMSKTKPTTYHPIEHWELVDPERLHANDYNPNRVFTPELELLKVSLEEDGWTQPIVARRDGEIVDGFHRWTLAVRYPTLRIRGKVPVVYLSAEKSRAEQMLSTVRHNRARGQHGILKMGEIVRELKASGLSEEELERRLKMEPEEQERLADLRTSPELAGKDSYGQAWVPDPDSRR